MRDPLAGAVNEIVITAARPDDLEGVLALLAEAGLPRDGVAEHFPHFLVARIGTTLVGAVGLELYGECVLLRSLVVASTERGRGLGQALTQRVLGQASVRGARRAFLLTETAAEFFPRLGFARIARDEADPNVQSSVEFRTACSQTAVCMRRDL